MKRYSLLIIALNNLRLFSSVSAFIPPPPTRRYHRTRPYYTETAEQRRERRGYNIIIRPPVLHNKRVRTRQTVWKEFDLPDASFFGSSGIRSKVFGLIVAAAAIVAGGGSLAVAALLRIFKDGGGSCPTRWYSSTSIPATRPTGIRTTSTMLGAWRCSGTTNAELIKNLVDANLVRTPRVAKAMQATDRGFYTSHDAYEDRPQPIGYRATISAPHMHAHALEVLSPAIPEEGGRVLDVGCGSGYLSGALARLVGENGVVFGMDYIPNLVTLTKTNLDSDDTNLLASGRVSLTTGDGWKGWVEEGPFDAIHVGAAAETIPEDLVGQLKVGGRMVVPVGPQSSSQMLVQVDRVKDSGPIAESYTTEGLMAVVYVPLVST